MSREMSIVIPNPPPVLDTLLEKNHYDVHFVCQDGVCKSHKLIMACVSTFLKDLMSETGVVEIVLPDVKKMDMEKCLEFIYKGKVMVSVAEVKPFNELLAMLCVLENFGGSRILNFKIMESSMVQSFTNENGEEVYECMVEENILGEANQDLTCVIAWENQDEALQAAADQAEKLTAGQMEVHNHENEIQMEHIDAQGSTDEFVDECDTKSHDGMEEDQDSASNVQLHVLQSTAFPEQAKSDSNMIILNHGTEASTSASGSAFKCEFCRRQFLTEEHLVFHVNNRHNVHHLCKVCNEAFPTVSAAKAHERSHKTIKKEQFPMDTVLSDGISREVVMVVSEMIEHNEDGSPKETVEEEEKPAKVVSVKKSNKRSQKPRGETEKRSYACNDCSKKFFTKWDLERHRRAHTGERPFGCRYCSKVFRRKEYCDRHERLHTGERAFPCKVCGKIFSARAHCDQHEMIHTGEKPFACSVCGQLFTRKSNLREHLLNHEGNKPYSCQVCNKTFARKNQCDAHELSHSGQKVHTCRYCEKGFMSKKGWMDHEQRHSVKMYLCYHCGRAFSSQAECSAHERTHDEMGADVFSCLTCNRVLKTERALVKHMTSKHKK